MKKFFLTLAVLVMAICASAQKNQYFWYQGNLMLGNPIAQIDSVTFGNADTDSILIYLPRTIVKTVEVHDTIYITIHDTVCPNAIPEGALNGVFSVSADKKVRFSKGNLQYQASTDTWRFAENQWDFVGEPNFNISPNYDGWIDLFGWGTGNNPTKWERNDSEYAQFTDWGDNFTPKWRTLSKAEWEYLLQGRENAANLYSYAIVENTKGFIFFPDNYPKTVSVQYDWNCSPITNAELLIMQNKGAVFLPAAGVRSTDVNEVRGYSGDYKAGACGDYWSSSTSSSTYAYYFLFSNEYYVGMESRPKSDGRAVRLVQDVTE